MRQRRKFLSTILGAGMAGMAPSLLWSQSLVTTGETLPVLKPKALKPGDTIGLIAPGFSVPPAILENTKKILVKMGYIPYHTPRILGNYGYFSNTDAERAADLNAMFANPHVAGILCARGGYGCTRILDMIDFGSIRSNPKVLIGFSDVTALLNGIHQKTGLISFHGPVGSTLADDYSIAELQKMVTAPGDRNPIPNAVFTGKPEFNKPEYDRYSICPGTANGKLVGGSLSLAAALMGTPYEIDFTDAIVCLEDIEEGPYRIDRMLTQLIQGKTFHKAAGLAFGVFKGCDSLPNKNTFTLKEVILDRIQPLNLPAAYGLTFGHIDHNFTFPIGGQAHLDANTMQLSIRENTVG